MSFRHHLLQPCRVIALALGLASAVIATAGEPIRFSKPAVPVAAPTQPQAELPEPRTRGMEFSAPEMDRPVIQPPQPAVRVGPREEKKDDRHWLLREPKMFSDPDQKPGETTSVTPPASRAASPWSNSRLGMQTPESMRALAPVTDFNWNARDSSHQKDVFGNSPSTKNDRNDPRARNSFGANEDSSVGSDAFRPRPLFEMFGGRAKEKPTAGQLERRAAFEQLMNPSANPASRGPNSLEPVVAASDSVKRPASLTMPIIGGATLAAKPSEPVSAFNQPHGRSSGSLFENSDRKYSAPQAAAPMSPLDPRYKTPLNQQPTVHEFPTRKF